MSSFNKEQYMPGVSTEVISDYKQTSYDMTFWNTTDSVVVIGTAFNGPSNVLTPVWNPNHAQYVFGNPYDPATKTEVDLLAGVQEAWDKGCRTIYCYRLGGKPLYKDFKFCADSKYKLRVSSVYPTNTGKQAYFIYDDTVGEESITLYKLPERATINERSQGLVDSASKMIKIKLELNRDYGLTNNSNLVDVLNIFNNPPFNNVIRLDVITKDGFVITSSTEAQNVSLGEMFHGVYFIGRSGNAKNIDARIKKTIHPVFNPETEQIPFEGFSEPYYFGLEYNYNYNLPYPIYDDNVVRMRKHFASVGITMIEKYDFLESIGASARAYPEDKVDYADTHLSDFEKYKLLGSGFAITASLQRRVDAKGKELLPKVIETKTSDANRVIGISEGAYSILQDAIIDFRALGSSFAADKVISGKLPKAKDFLVSQPVTTSMFKSGAEGSDESYLVNLIAKVNKDVNKQVVKKYSIALKSFDIKKFPALTEKTVYTDEVFTLLPMVDKKEDVDLTLKNGTLVFVKKEGGSAVAVPGVAAAPAVYILKKIEDGELKDVDPEIYDFKTKDGQAKHKIFAGNNHKLYESYINDKVLEFKEKSLTLTGDQKYILVEQDHGVYVWKKDLTDYIPVADYTTLYQNYGAEGGIYIYIESLPMVENKIIIYGADLDTITLNEFVDKLNEYELFNHFFKMALTTQGNIFKTEYMQDYIDPDNHKVISKGVAADIIDKKELVIEKDREVVYDYNKYIPYRTTDNFARQLAQHCTYTELKTAKTHGIIGCNRLLDITYSNIARKVASILAFNFDMYAKKPNGHNLLDNKNLPYNIGRNVSIILAQEPTSIDSGAYTILTTGACAYAGMISSLPLAQSTTAQKIDFSPEYELTHSQLQDLTNKGIVTVRNSYTKGYIITDGITMAEPEDGLKRLSTTRIVGAVEGAIREASEPYIGKPNNTLNRNSLQTAIDAKLKIIQTNGLLQSYEFHLIDDVTAMQYNYISIDYTIVPVTEIREVRNRLVVRNAAV